MKNTTRSRKMFLMIGMLTILLSSTVSIGFSREVHEAEFTPWSGYWWPVNRGGLVNGIGYYGTPSPLGKYDLLETGALEGPAVKWYKENYYLPDAPSWFGHCGDWAAAACYENYDIWPSSEDNIIFRVGDKKGLLTLSHDFDIAEKGDGSKPEEFHLWLLTNIQDKGEAFWADLDSGEEKWNYPIYKFDMESTINLDREVVTVTIYYANDDVHPDHMGTDVLQDTFTYELFLNENSEIYSGQWTGRSVDHHPQQMQKPLLQQSRCPYLDYDLIKTIAQNRDDHLEIYENTRMVPPGTYNLILMNEDQHKIDCEQGEAVSISIEKQDGSNESMTVNIIDSLGAVFHSQVVDDNTPMKIVFESEQTPYSIKIFQDDYSDPNIYTMTIDMVKRYSQRIPYIPKNGNWSGFAITNYNTQNISDLFLTSYKDDGTPIETLLEPIMIEPNEKILFLFDELPIRLKDYTDTRKIHVMASRPFGFVNLVGDKKRTALFSLVQNGSKGGHLILPDTTGVFSVGRNMSGELVNETLETTTVRLKVFSENGTLFNDKEDTINPKESYAIHAGTYPFYSLPDYGWIEISGQSNLSGYQYLTTDKMADGMFALSVSSSPLIVPHITPPYSETWETSLTLINPNDIENTIRLHTAIDGNSQVNDQILTLGPREKISLSIHERFGKAPDDNRSILKIYPEAPMAGYFSYKLVQSGETAGLPLMNASDFKSELILPHCASQQGIWWTGVGIANIGESDTSISIEPYDRNGGLMTGELKVMDIPKGGYTVFILRKLFGADKAAGISFLKIRSDSGEDGALAGFYLYGDSSGDILSGANM